MDQGEVAAPRCGDTRSGIVAGAEAPNPDCEPAAAEVRSRSARRSATMGQLTRNRLGMQLRAMYDTVAQQPVPDRFADLIARLESADVKKV